MVKLMKPTLQEEIKQSVPFRSLKEEVLLNLARTAAMVGHGLEHRLRPYGLSMTQYNVLRILRGAGAEGLCQYEIRKRLVAQVPDVPRILDRMEKAAWVRRVRSASDRRMVMTSLSDEGSRLVGELDAPLEEIMTGMFPQLDQTQMTALNELLVAARAGNACETPADDGAEEDGEV